MGTGETANIDGADMGTAGLLGRNALDIGVIRSLSKRSDLQGVMRCVAHLAVMTATGTLVWFALPHWYLLLPAMFLHGCTLVTMFAPMHECVHRTAFATPKLNEIFGWIAGVLSFYNFHFYRHYHTWHHRYTQDPQRDPELSPPKAHNLREYAQEIIGWNWWFYRPRFFWKMMTGQLSDLPYIPAEARRRVQISATAQVGVYVLGLVAAAFGYRYFLYWWLFPMLLAQPFLRFLLIAEHTGCSLDENGLTNTRTTLASFPVRLLMWNMPYHAEHHMYPSIPFYQLPDAHRELKAKLMHVEPGYVAANRTIIAGLRAGAEQHA